MNTEAAIDLTVKSRSSSESEPCEVKADSVSSINNKKLVRPIPRPPWSIIWYQSLWPSFGNSSLPLQNPPRSYETRYNTVIPNQDNAQNFTSQLLEKDSAKTTWRRNNDVENRASPTNSLTKKHHDQAVPHYTLKRSQEEEKDEAIDHREDECARVKNHPQYQEARIKEGRVAGDENQVATIIDVACCDGPIRFERISNPNFALTVEHQNEPMGSTTTSSTVTEPTCRNPTSKTYVCIYCSQSFKSLFCYQKHKKRHLNPVSVDITGTNINTPMVCPPENRANTKDLNVQFFPCKKCGCKFPSYYFVHKHKKTCH